MNTQDTADLFLDFHQNTRRKPEGVQIEWRLSAYGLFVEEKEGKTCVLCVVPKWHNRYDLPGGGAELQKCESLRDAGTRETKEETGFRSELEEQPWYVGESNFCLTFGEEGEIQIVRFYRAVHHIFRGRLLHEAEDAAATNMSDLQETTKIEWVPLENLTEENMQRIFWPAIKKLQESAGIK